MVKVMQRCLTRRSRGTGEKLRFCPAPELERSGSRKCTGSLFMARLYTHDQLVRTLMHRLGVRAEVARIEREKSALLKARQKAGLTQAQVAERMGTQAPAVARLERALASGKHSPSIATLRKYVKACGKRLVLRVA